MAHPPAYHSGSYSCWDNAYGGVDMRKMSTVFKSSGLDQKQLDAVQALLSAKTMCDAILRGETIDRMALANGIAPQIRKALEGLMEPVK